MTGRARRLLLAVTVLAAGLAAPAAPGAASVTAGGFTAYEVVRVRKGGPSSLTIAAYGSRDDGVVLSVVALRKRGGRRTVVDAYVNQYWRGDKTEVHAGGHEITPECTPAWPCRGSTVSRTFAVRVSAATTMSYVVAGPADSLRLWLSSPYWQARPVRGIVRAVSGEDAAAGAENADTEAEVFTGASATGGRYGSLAYARIPCGKEHKAGSATFTGGGRTAEMWCDDPDRVVLWGVATGATEWSVDGVVVSAGSTPPLRLFVVDVPK